MSVGNVTRLGVDAPRIATTERRRAAAGTGGVDAADVGRWRSEPDGTKAGRGAEARVTAAVEAGAEAETGCGVRVLLSHVPLWRREGDDCCLRPRGTGWRRWLPVPEMAWLPHHADAARHAAATGGAQRGGTGVCGAGGGRGLWQQHGAGYQNLLEQQSSQALLAAARPDVVGCMSMACIRQACVCCCMASDRGFRHGLASDMASDRARVGCIRQR